MSHLSFLTRAEIEKLGPPTPEDLEETGVSDALLRNLALKQVATQTDATSALVAEKLHLSSTLPKERRWHHPLCDARCRLGATGKHGVAQRLSRTSARIAC